MTREEAIKELQARGYDIDQLKLERQQRKLDEADDFARTGKTPEQLAAIEELRKRGYFDKKEEEAAEETQKAPDSLGDDVLDVAGEVSASANRTAIAGLDLLSSPLRGAANLGAWVAGSDKRMPTFQELLEPTGIEGGFMDEGAARDVAQAVGALIPVGGGLMQINRAMTPTNIAKDIAGFGSTAPVTKAVDYTPGVFDAENATEGQIAAEVNRWNRAELAKKNRFRYDEAEEIDAKLTKGEPQVSEKDIPTAENMSLPQAQKYMEDTYGISPAETAEALRKNGGIRFDDTPRNPSVMEVMEQDRIFTQQRGRKSDNDFINWYDRAFTPVTDILRRRYDPKVANAMDRSYESATRNMAHFVDNYMVPMRNVYKYVGEDKEAKALLMDMWKHPENIDVFRAKLHKDLMPSDVRAFDKFWKYAEAKNKQMRERVFKTTDDADYDLNYIHTQKNSATEKAPFDANPWRPKHAKVDALRTRTRQLSKDMDPEDFDLYQNPLLSHSKYIADNEALMEMSENFGMRNSIPMGGSEKDFFDTMRDRLINDGWDKEKAKQASTIMLDAYQGSKQAPPAAIRAFMNLSYAGTLGNLRSAVLNLHDVAVSAVNNGTVPTLKALFNTTKGEFGESVRNMLGDQNFGEFVRDFDRYMQSPKLMDKINYGSRKISDGAMAVSGFRKMDEIGKGVVLRAAVNEARDKAAAGTFMRDMKDFILDPAARRKADIWLKTGKPVKDMPADVQKTVEDMAFAKLGQQQLITAAGRPLGYLNQPLLRPAYAMTGFAIKQQALLRRNVLDALREGNGKEAAFYAAKYIAYAGMGYGFINETRNAVFKGEDFGPEDVLLGAVDQVAAATTLNRLGDEYSRAKFAENPVDFLMTSFIPPGGMVEKWMRGEIIESVPVVGQLYKDRIKEEEDAE